LARLLSQRGRPAEAVALCDGVADPADPLLRAQLAVTRGQALIPLARYDEAIAEATRALDLSGRATGAPAGNLAEVEARAHTTLGQALRVHRRFDAAADHLARAVAAAERAGRAELVNRSRYVHANILLERGDTAAAEAMYADALAGCERVGDGYGAARVLQALTHVHLNRGDLAVALKTIDRSREIRAQLGNPGDIANADTVRAEVLLALGRVGEAHEVIGAVVAAGSANPWERSYHLAVLAQAHLVSGEPEAAAALLRDALARPGLEGTAVRVLLRAYLAVALLVAGRDANLDDGDPGNGDGPVSPGVDLDLHVLAVVRAAAGGDGAGATRSVAALRARATALGHLRYETVADELAAGLAAGTPLAELPRLVWGGGTVRSR
jgi:tetratricopeptide (TPR) repeat protein